MPLTGDIAELIVEIERIEKLIAQLQEAIQDAIARKQNPSRALRP